MAETSHAWWRVPQLARLLRVHPDTIYDAIASGQLPAKKVANFYIVPSEALGLTVKPPVPPQNAPVSQDDLQLVLPLDPKSLCPVRRYRDGSPKNPWDYEHALFLRKR